MTTALTITASTALTVNYVPTIERTYVKPARDGAEIIDRVRDASASVADVGRFLRVLGSRLDKSDLLVVEYALARARYREGYDLTVRQLALLAEMSIEKVRKYLRRLQIAAGDKVTNMQASTMLSAVADYS